MIIEPTESGLLERSVANCSQLATIQRAGPSSRLRPPRGEAAVQPIGCLSAAKMAEVDEALRYSLGLQA